MWNVDVPAIDRNTPLSRRQFVGTSLALLTTPFLQSLSKSQEVHQKHPNIVFILADDMGFGDLGCYGATKIQTPHMDTLATQGLRLTNAHTPGAICQPTRYGILTGRYFWRSEKAVAGFKKHMLNGYMPSMVEKERLTLPSLLKGAGYATHYIGKWHLGVDWRTRDRKIPTADGANVDHGVPFHGGPVDYDFDSGFGLVASLNMPPYCFFENDRVVGSPLVPRRQFSRFCGKGLMTPQWREEEVGPTLTERAVQKIETHSKDGSKEPFFLYLALSAPHAPCVPPDFIKGKSQAGVRGDMVAEVDWTVGKIMHALERAGMEKDTLLIVTSDNGGIVDGVPAWRIDPRKYEIEDYGHRANGYLRGQKGDTWEGGHRVPFIARWPGRIATGQTRNDMICLTDLMATYAALIGKTLPENAGEDSLNILPVLLNQTSKHPIRESVIHHAWRDQSFGITDGRWKLIDWPISGGFMGPAYVKPLPGEAPGQLYDIIKDPGETRNLWQHRPDVVKRLLALLRQQIAGRAVSAR